MLLEVKDLNISLTSGKSVAEHISFQLGQGEMLSIVGSSGAGKTTICKAIMGLLGTLIVLMAKSCSKRKICSTCRNESGKLSMGKKSA